MDGLIEFLRHLARRFLSTTHHLGNQLIELTDDGARVETSCLAWYRLPARDGAERSIAQGLRYLDRLERRNATWAIAHRRVVLDWEQLFEPGRPSIVDPGWSRGTADSTDPSYAR